MHPSPRLPPGHAGVTQIDRVVEAVEETLKGNVVHLLAKKKLPRLDLPKVSLLPACSLGHVMTCCLPCMRQWGTSCRVLRA